jgi:hypothetical protein
MIQMPKLSQLATKFLTLAPEPVSIDPLSEPPSPTPAPDLSDIDPHTRKQREDEIYWAEPKRRRLAEKESADAYYAERVRRRMEIEEKVAAEHHARWARAPEVIK